MEQIYFGARIAAYRKEQDLTQEGLAQRLGVTNQAVSKWEADQCCPDIMLLPALADVFGVTIDALFARETPAVPQADTRPAGMVVEDLPWPDDNDLRAVCYVGRRLVQFGTREPRRGLLGLGGEAIELHFSGSVDNIHAQGSVYAENCAVNGSVYADDGVHCGDVGGNVEAGDGVNCGDVGGSVNAGDGVNCGNVGGNVEAGDGVNCGNIQGSAEAGDSIKCGSIGGNATAGDSIRCAYVGGTVIAGDDED